MNLFCYLGVFWKKKGSENSRKEAEVADGTLAVILIQGRLTFTYEAERDLSSPELIPWTAFAGPLTDIRVSPVRTVSVSHGGLTCVPGAGNCLLSAGRHSTLIPTLRGDSTLQIAFTLKPKNLR